MTERMYINQLHNTRTRIDTASEYGCYLGQVGQQKQEEQHRQAFERVRGDVDLLQWVVHPTGLQQQRGLRQQRVDLGGISVCLWVAVVALDVSDHAHIESVQGLVQ